ncbi:hypothetical protein DL95DRAFT_414865 [Leptodontidium sp. 2 PMI_412]|nr:hypothetical protein DL95DRAFT_414865 [Leptodontidium sp. 2 PMI_412]
MSSDETERFLKQWATTVPLPNGPGEGTLMAYGDLQKSVNSYLQTIRDESVELPLELRLSKEMQIYQARQMAVLEYWSFPGHSAFPPPPDPAAYEAVAHRRIELLIASQNLRLDESSASTVSVHPPNVLRPPKPTTPSCTPPQVAFRKPPSSVKARSYRKQITSQEDSNEDLPQPPKRIPNPRKSPTPPSTEISSLQKSDSHVKKTNVSSLKAVPNSDTPRQTIGTTTLASQSASSRRQLTGLPSTVTGATIHRERVPPIWPIMKLEGGWDFLTGFPSGAFVFSSVRAFPRIIGPLDSGVGQVIGGVNRQFPLLRLRWERAAVKQDGRRDLAVWVEFAIGVPPTDLKAVSEKDVVTRGLQEFHWKDAAGWNKYLDVYFAENVDRLRAESQASRTTTSNPPNPPLQEVRATVRDARRDNSQTRNRRSNENARGEVRQEKKRYIEGEGWV